MTYQYKNALRAFAIGAAGIVALQGAASANSFLKDNTGSLPTGGKENNIYGYVYELDSTVVTNEVTTKTCVQATADMIADRMNVGKNGDAKNATIFAVGRGSQGEAHKMGLWAKYRWDKMDDKTTGGKWNANQHMIGVGADYLVNCNLLLGAGLMYANLNGKTKYNLGDIKDNAFGVAPYMKFMVSDHLDLDLIGGYYHVMRERKRTALNTADPHGFSSVKNKTKPKSNLFFVHPAANFKHNVSMADLHLRVGFMYAEDKQKSFKEKGVVDTDQGKLKEYNALKTKVNRFTSRFNVGFRVSDMVTPYATVFYYRDGNTQNRSKVFQDDADLGYTNPLQHRSKNTFGGGLGVSMMPTKNWSGNLGYDYQKNKSIKTHSVKFEARYRF